MKKYNADPSPLSIINSAYRKPKPKSDLFEEFINIYFNCYITYLKEDYLPVYHVHREVFSKLVISYLTSETPENQLADSLKTLIETSVTENRANEAPFSVIPLLHKKMLQAAENDDFDYAVTLCYRLVGALSDGIDLMNMQASKAEQLTLFPIKNMTKNSKESTNHKKV